MPLICKDVNVTGGTIDKDCCGCDFTGSSPNSGAITPLIEIDYHNKDILFDYSSTQYIIPIDIVCGCDYGIDLSTPYTITSIPHNIRVISTSNPANVTFLYVAGSNPITLTRTRTGTTYTYTHTTPSNGQMYMVVDKDPNEVEIPKASTIQIGITPCASDMEVTQTIKTEWFFNRNNFRGCCGYGNFLPGNLFVNFTNPYINANCKEDMGTYWRYTLALWEECQTGSKPFQTLTYSYVKLGRTIQSVDVIGETTANAPWTSINPTTVTANYDTTLGIWFLHVPKTYTSNFNVILELDVNYIENDPPCVDCIGSGPFDRNAYEITNKKLVSNLSDPFTPTTSIPQKLNYIVYLNSTSTC